METFSTVLKWLEPILTILTGGSVFPFVYNRAGIFMLGVIFLVVKLLRKLKVNDIYLLITIGVLSLSIDLTYRHWYQSYGSLRNILNWVSIYRGGQIFFIPIWIFGLIGISFGIIRMVSRILDENKKMMQREHKMRIEDFERAKKFFENKT